MENQALKEQYQGEVATLGDTALQELLDDQLIMDVAELIEAYPEEDVRIITHLSIQRAVSVFKILDLQDQQRLIERLPRKKVGDIINDMPPDDRTALFEELPGNLVKELLKLLRFDELKVTLKLLGYPEDSVGRLMTPDYLDVKEEWTVQEGLDHIRHFGKDSETIDVVYVINKEGKLVDDLRIREFLLVDPEIKIKDLTDGRYTSLSVTDTQEEALAIFRKENRVALPVIDEHHTLLGIVTIDDMLSVANEEYTEDIQKMGGTEALEEPYLDINLFKLFRKRGGVLVVLFIGEMLTATAMQHYQDSGIFTKFADLILFIPLILSCGGNSGSQATTLIVQSIALGEITIKDWWRIMRREFVSGTMLGAFLGAIGFIRITIWQLAGIYDYGPHWQLMAFTIFFALIGVILWGSLMGSMSPIVLKKVGIDPATSSAPFVATVVDVTGIIIYCTVAIIILRNVLA